MTSGTSKPMRPHRNLCTIPLARRMGTTRTMANTAAEWGADAVVSQQMWQAQAQTHLWQAGRQAGRGRGSVISVMRGGQQQ